MVYGDQARKLGDLSKKPSCAKCGKEFGLTEIYYYNKQKPDIIYCELCASQEGLIKLQTPKRKTSIIYGCNLSYIQCETLLQLLTSKKLLTIHDKFYVTSASGLKLITVFNTMQNY